MLCGHRGVVVLLQSYCSQTVPACRSCLSMFKSLTRAAWTDACTVLVLLRSLHRDYWWTAPWTAPGSRVFVQCIYFHVFMQLSLMACLQSAVKRMQTAGVGKPPLSDLMQPWLILPAVIRLSQGLSHACVSVRSEEMKLRFAH
jgi:hypothetical protein